MKTKIKSLNNQTLNESNRKYLNELLGSISLRQAKLKLKLQPKRKATAES